MSARAGLCVCRVPFEPEQFVLFALHCDSDLMKITARLGSSLCCDGVKLTLHCLINTQRTTKATSLAIVIIAVFKMLLSTIWNLEKAERTEVGVYLL